MRRQDREIRDAAEIEAILARATVVHVAMVEMGQPYVVPMNFGFADGCLYLHCAREGRKVRALRANPAVCFNVFADDALLPGAPPFGCSFTSRYRSVTGEGRAEFIEDAAAKRKALDIILAHYAPGPFEYADKAVAATCVIRVAVATLTGKKANL